MIDFSLNDGTNGWQAKHDSYGQDRKTLTFKALL